MAAHLIAIGDVSDETRATYVALARATADRALANGMLRPAAAESRAAVRHRQRRRASHRGGGGVFASAQDAAGNVWSFGTVYGNGPDYNILLNGAATIAHGIQIDTDHLRFTDVAVET